MYGALSRIRNTMADPPKSEVDHWILSQLLELYEGLIERMEERYGVLETYKNKPVDVKKFKEKVAIKKQKRKSKKYAPVNPEVSFNLDFS